ncbi:AMP-binding domain-containing protein/DUF3353 domain-containing protein/DUF4009 domain-containing protein [Cephalotus follicularis]|uniref:AMP-binding domain-containing protein/DUF3353 domain-containing protein/DUF4009 domain-containing protein n=1 Tax=Cephalotus follicularis TaxID=3775 RepID=A0A1Q3B7E6_CEPFO|nr:AMP-binding domain-containing protein/DUF3353 domain-containing protein/DUF4009 domain-containing protein [Cephalotus follicularis]
MAYKGLDCISKSDIEALGIPSQAADKHHQKLTEIIHTYGTDTPATWQNITSQILLPHLPFSFHQMLYYGCYKGFAPDPPAWLPHPESAILTNVGRLLESRGKEFLGSKYKDPISSFSDFQEYSVLNPEVYWKTIMDELCVSFSIPPQCILRENTIGNRLSSNPGGQWLPGAFVNPARNCLSLNSKRKLNGIAIRWRDEGDDYLPVKSMTFKDLRAEVWLIAYALNALGLEKRSAIAIDMPMNVNSVFIYLAIVLAGHVVVSIADSFAAPEISTRLKISGAKAIFTQDRIIRGDKSIPLYSRVVDAQAPMAIVIPTQGSTFSMELRDGDIYWHDFLETVRNLKEHEFVAVEQPVEAFTNILFSSGTTGEPKAIPWTHITPFKAAADAWCHMDIQSGDIIAWPTNLGWMMGPWLVYASLLNGASMALFNGSPLGSGFAKFVQDAKVTMLGVIPSIVRAWKSTNCTAGYDWSAIRCFSSTGEASNVDEYLWLMGRSYYKPIIEYCGGTEIGGGFISGSLLQAQSLAAFSTPAMGCSLYILGDDGYPIPQNTPGMGELALGPLLFGASSTLLNADHYGVYFRGMPIWNGKILRRHGDVFERTSRGYYHAHGRADDTMNLGGIKVSSIEIERICNAVDANILETAAVGVPPPEGGPERLVIAVVFKDSNNSTPDLNQLRMSFNSVVQKTLNPLFRVSRVVPLSSLPRTATNKVMRRVLRQHFTQPDENSKLSCRLITKEASVNHCPNFRRNLKKNTRCALDTPYGGNAPKLPRINVWDPYKRLGVSPYASEEEIWGSRNFLLQQYAGHEISEESIEAAFEKLLMTSFKQRKKTKINLKSRLKKKVEESPPWVKNLLKFVELPPVEVIFRRLFLFAFMGGWSIMNSAEGGPAFQVAVSLAACIYFLNEKTKSLGRAFIIGFGALAAGWVCGSIFAPMIPTVLIHPTWTLELMTSLVAYGFLFLACTFLK